MLSTILLVFAFVFACVAVWQSGAQPSPWPSRLIALSLAFYFLSVLLGGLGIGLHSVR